MGIRHTGGGFWLLIGMKRQIGEIVVFPARFFFGSVDRGKASSRKVEISKLGEKNLGITSVEAASEFISVRVITIQEGRKYAIEATLSENAPPGTIRDTVKVHTSNPIQPIINISLYALVQE